MRCESNATFGSTDEISSPDRAHIASVAVASRSADPSLSLSLSADRSAGQQELRAASRACLEKWL